MYSVSFSCLIDHFTVVCSVTWPLNGSEAEGDFVLIKTSLILLCKSSCFNANYVQKERKQKGLYQSKVTSSLAAIQARGPFHEAPDNLTGPNSDFEIKVSRK